MLYSNRSSPMNALSSFRAVVFDFDGLILDTERPEFEAWRHVFQEHGVEPLTVEEWAHCIGTRDALDPLDVLAERLGEPLPDRDAAKALGKPRHDELLALEEALPGVVDWLDEADALGLAVAVASSSHLEWVQGHLERLSLVDRFACLSCFDDVLQAKPAPDIYLAACESLGVAPSEAVAVEDSRNGVLAAKAAGMAAVAVPHGLTAHLDFSEADLVLASLAEMPLRDALTRLARS